jgi:prophage tail gpP-like protein
MSGDQSFISDLVGTVDPVVLELNGQQALYAQGWSIAESILQQPSHWSISLGSEAGALDLYAACPPHTPFSISILGKKQATGRTDARELEMAGSGSLLTIRGRDALAPLHDGFVQADRSFPDTTYTALVWAVLGEVGVVPKTSRVDPALLKASNAANRSLKAGVPITEIEPPEQVNQIAQTPIGATLGAISMNIQAKVGERWLEFLRHHLDRAGLFLWAAADGTFVLSTPNPKQTPTYKLYRQIQVDNLTTNVLGWGIADDATHRHSEATIYGRGGGRKKGRQKAKGAYADKEMQDWGYDQAFTIRDRYVQTGIQAAYRARRALAEERRNGWRLEYTIAGNTLPVAGSSTDRAVVTTDTTVDVADDLLGIYGTFYIETVHRERGPQTQTTIRLMRPDDLVFGDISGKSTTGAVTPTEKPNPTGFKQNFNYLAEGHPPTAPSPGDEPFGAVGQNGAGQWIDANGNVIP